MFSRGRIIFSNFKHADIKVLGCASRAQVFLADGHCKVTFHGVKKRQVT